MPRLTDAACRRKDKTPRAAAEHPGAAKKINSERDREKQGRRTNGALCPGRPLGVPPGIKPSSVFLFKCLTGFCLEIVDRFSIQHISECLPSYFSFHHTVQRKCGGVFTTSIQRLLPSGGSAVKNLPANARDTRDGVRSLGREDPLENKMATHSSNLAREIPWTESLAVHGVAKSWTRLSG